MYGDDERVVISGAIDSGLSSYSFNLTTVMETSTADLCLAIKGISYAHWKQINSAVSLCRTRCGSPTHAT